MADTKPKERRKRKAMRRERSDKVFIDIRFERCRRYERVSCMIQDRKKKARRSMNSMLLGLRCCSFVILCIDTSWLNKPLLAHCLTELVP